MSDSAEIRAAAARAHGGRNGDAPVGRQDSPAVEDAVVERVTVKLAPTPGEARRSSSSDGVLFDEAGPVRALAIHEPPPSSATPPPPSGAVLHPSITSAIRDRRWIFAQVVAEVRLLLRMYFDPQYRISRTLQFALPAILLLFGFNYFFFAVWFPVPVLSPILERLICVVLGVVLYQMLSREMTRYREVLAYLARHGYR